VQPRPVAAVTLRDRKFYRRVFPSQVPNVCDLRGGKKRIRTGTVSGDVDSAVPEGVGSDTPRSIKNKNNCCLCSQPIALP